MCTLTWISEPESYELHFNRDERRTRLPAEPPVLQGTGTGAFVAPRDGDEGGSWISVNAAGLSLALLNRYQDRFEPATPVSRGKLVFELAPLPGLDAVTDALRRRKLDEYRPFDLAVFSLAAGPRIHHWDGRELSLRELSPAEMPLASSGFDQPGAQRHRRECLARTLGGEDPSRERLVEYHRSHLPWQGAYSVCMHRADASTVSYSQVRASPRRAIFEYRRGAPCEGAPATRVELEVNRSQGDLR